MFRNNKSSNKSLLVLVAVICFAIAVITHAGWVTLDAKIDWTDLGLFFGFLSFIF
jgi:biotin transporter BioY